MSSRTWSGSPGTDWRSGKRRRTTIMYAKMTMSMANVRDVPAPVVAQGRRSRGWRSSWTDPHAPESTLSAATATRCTVTMRGFGLDSEPRRRRFDGESEGIGRELAMVSRGRSYRPRGVDVVAIRPWRRGMAATPCPLSPVCYREQRKGKRPWWRATVALGF